MSAEKLILDCALQETSMTDLSPEDSISAEIADLPPEAQMRVNTIADMLRAIAETDAEDETELAMLLVLEEIQGDCAACACVDETVQ